MCPFFPVIMQTNSSSSSADSGFQVFGSTAAKKFIAAYDNGHNISEMKDALKELSREQGDDIFYSSSLYPQLLKRFENVISAAADTKETSPNVVLILQHLICASKESERMRICFRDDYGFFMHLASLFNPDREDDADLILECAEIISRGLVVSWKAPYLQGIINKCFTYILNPENEQRTFDKVLQLLINLCRKNPSSVMMVRQHRNFHEVWARMRSFFNHEYSTLMTHLLFLLEPTIPVANFCSGREVFSRGLDKVLETWSKSPPENIDEADLSSQLMKIGQLIESILDKMRPIFESISVEEEKSVLSQMKLSSEHYQEVKDTKTILMEKLICIQNFVKMDFTWSSVAVNELLRLLLLMFPNFSRRVLSTDLYMITFEIVDRIVSRTGNDTKSFTSCLKAFHYVVKHLSVMESPKKTELGSHLSQALNRIELVVENSPEAIERNITCLQLMSCLADFHATSELVLERLNTDTLEALLDITSREDESLPVQLQLIRSICVVELLYLLSLYSKHSHIVNLIMKSISLTATYSHISNCILNASEEVVERALHVTASVGFYGKRASVGVAKQLMMKRDRPLAIKGCPQIATLQLSANSITGATHLNETLRSIGDLVEMNQSNISNDETMASDIFAWYRLNKEMYEHDIFNLNSHIYHQNKTIVHLKYLLEKQTEFVSCRLAEKDMKDVEIISLKHRLEKAGNEIMTITTTTKTELGQLKESLLLKTEAYKTVSGKLKEVEKSYEELRVQSQKAIKEQASLTEKVKELKTDNKELTTESAKIKKDLKECKERLTKLESEVKKKEEERLAVTAILDEKTKVLETIQGLMGVRAFK